MVTPRANGPQAHINSETINEVMLGHATAVHALHAQAVMLRRYFGHATTHVGPGWRQCPAQVCRDALALHKKVFAEVGPILTPLPYRGYTRWQKALKGIQKKIARKPELGEPL